MTKYANIDITKAIHGDEMYIAGAWSAIDMVRTYDNDRVSVLFKADPYRAFDFVTTDNALMVRRAMRNIVATTETESRDCDGMHYGGATYEMDEEERIDPFGDFDFYKRIMGYVVSLVSEHGTLTVTKDEKGLPIYDWSEQTEEGFHTCRATFHNQEN